MIKRKVFLWAVLASYITATLLSVAAVLVSVSVTARIDQNSNKRWCTLLSTLDQAYKEIPPTSPVGRNIAHEIHKIRIDFGC